MKKKRKWYKIVIVASLLAIVLVCTFVWSINAYMKQVTKDHILTLEEASLLSDVDCILVLGCKVYGDGRLSPMLRDRLESAAGIYKTGVTEKLLMSGDHGRADYNEVQAMKDYMIDKGVASSEDIFMDHAGFSTYESLFRARDIFSAHKIIVVTHDYHQYRALYIANKLGLEAYGIAVEDNYAGNGRRLVRECVARCKDFLQCILQPAPTYLGDKIDLSGSGDITND